MHDNITIVGGVFDNTTHIKSECIDSLAAGFKSCSYKVTVYNGGLLDDLPEAAEDFITIWSPNIANNATKRYPKKKTGNILICSKFMSKEQTRIDAVSQVFKMNADAVIAIYREPNKKYKFELIDSLNNTWYCEYNLTFLQLAIERFVSFLKINRNNTAIIKANIIDQIKFNLTYYQGKNLYDLMGLNNQLVSRLYTHIYGPNLDEIPRQDFLYPSMRTNNKNIILVSPEKYAGGLLYRSHMIKAMLGDNSLIYDRNKTQPCSDSFTHLKLYKAFPNINYMIHGHASVNNCSACTSLYKLGNAYDADEIIIPVIANLNKQKGIINLKRHGFLIYADTLKNLETLIKTHDYNIKPSLSDVNHADMF